MSWNRPARALVVCAALASALTLAGCTKKTTPSLSGRPNGISTTTTTAATTSSTSSTSSTSTTAP
jgi:ABC-type uncharacterized transport system auxiliary subunit